MAGAQNKPIGNCYWQLSAGYFQTGLFCSSPSERWVFHYSFGLSGVLTLIHMIFEVFGKRATIVGVKVMGEAKFVVTEQLEVNSQQLDNLYSCFLHAFRHWLAL